MDKIEAIKFIINGITGNKKCLPDYNKNLDTQFLEFTVKTLIENDCKNLNVYLYMVDDTVVNSTVNSPVNYENIYVLDSNQINSLMNDPIYAYPEYLRTQVHFQTPDKSEQYLYKVMRSCICRYHGISSDVLTTLGSGKYVEDNSLDVFNVLSSITTDLNTLKSLALSYDYMLSVFEITEPTSDYDRYVVWPVCNNMRMIEQKGKGYLYSFDKNAEVFDFRNFGTEIFRHSIPAKYKEVQRYFLSELLTLLSY